jgi:hypothetical protein
VAASTSPKPSVPNRDWAADTADSIDKLVDKVRSKTTTPLERFTRVIVYGSLCAILGLVALVMLIIALVRALDEAIPGEVWPAHLILGGIFIAVGLFMWSRRTGPATD